MLVLYCKFIVDLNKYYNNKINNFSIAEYYLIKLKLQLTYKIKYKYFFICCLLLKLEFIVIQRTILK